MSFASALETSRRHPTDADALADLAETALQEGEEEQALPLVARGTASLRLAHLWQWKGLLERALDEHEQALRSFAEAARLDPSNASIAHGRARVALEAGVPAETLFTQALKLARSDSAVLLGLMAARLAAGHGDQAELELDGVLERSPLWAEGHMQLAQLRSMLGKRALASASLERALERDPGQAQLWKTLFDLLVKSGDFDSLEEALKRARAAGAGEATVLPYSTIAAAESGRTEDADRLFAENDSTGGPGLSIWKIRHLLRSGRPQQAEQIIDKELAGAGAAHAWPYAAIAWRLTGDPRLDWLLATQAPVATFDLASSLPPLDRLAAVLRSIHSATGEFLDQSVRGGTQTDGPLFSRIEPEIRSLRSAIVTAVERYLQQLPPPDPKHPLLAPRRDRPIRFSGSWSVRLRDGGHHAAHVHPQGWISSALYIALPPEEVIGQANAGWLTLGAPPPELELGLSPTRLVEPKTGQLVLFPSWMWHGTLPFPAGERLTVAFDVSSPR